MKYAVQASSSSALINKNHNLIKNQLAYNTINSNENKLTLTSIKIKIFWKWLIKAKKKNRNTKAQR